MKRARNHRQLDVEQRFAKPFWDVIQTLADEGLNRVEIAERLGWADQKWGYRYFLVLICRNPGRVKWPDKPNAAQALYRRTGETLGQACRRLAAEGHAVTSAAHSIGYSSASALRYALEARGIDVEFPPATRYVRVATQQIVE